MEKLKSWRFGKIRDLVLSIQDEMKYDSEYQVRFKRQGLGRKWTEIKDDINRWQDSPFSWQEESILWKWLYYQMQSTDSMQSLSNYQWHFSQNQNKNFTIHMETQKTANSQNSHEKEKWSWRNQPSWLETISSLTTYNWEVRKILQYNSSLKIQVI